VNESIVDNACDTVGKDTSTLSGQELPGQRAHDNDGVNSVDKATDANGNPCKDSDHTIDAENLTVDEPDCTLDIVEVNTVGEANENNGHPSQESDVTVDAENSNIDGLDIIHDSSKQLTHMLSRQNQLSILMLIIMMYHKKNYQFNPLMKVRKSIQFLRQLM
jgi:hypothetical protein